MKLFILIILALGLTSFTAKANEPVDYSDRGFVDASTSSAVTEVNSIMNTCPTCQASCSSGVGMNEGHTRSDQSCQDLVNRAPTLLGSKGKAEEGQKETQ